jgi:large subunit ribosomal protein L19
VKQNQKIADFEKGLLSKNIPEFSVGDTIRVFVRIIEGEKERTQLFTGTVVARKGSGLSETISLYRNAYGCCMERVFLLHSPRIAKIEVARSGKVRRAKLYYLRGASGKAAKVSGQEKRIIEDDVIPAQTEATVENKE